VRRAALSLPKRDQPAKGAAAPVDYSEEEVERGIRRARDVVRVFSLEKAAQVSATFIALAPNHRLNRLKLMKLLFLADRTAFAEHGMTITGDKLVSMDQGPVLSGTLDALKEAPAYRPVFEAWVQRDGQYDHVLAPGADISRATKLSRADLAVIASVWQQFGHLNQWQLTDWVHDHCPEWTHPSGSSIPIAFESLAASVGISQEEASALLEQEREAEDLRSVLASL
jgi:uncharacterized phage-associated protein